MTMETMDKIFKTKDEGYDYSFEVLIERNDQNKNIVINNYIEAIRNLIHKHLSINQNSLTFLLDC